MDFCCRFFFFYSIDRRFQLLKAGAFYLPNNYFFHLWIEKHYSLVSFQLSGKNWSHLGQGTCSNHMGGWSYLCDIFLDCLLMECCLSYCRQDHLMAGQQCLGCVKKAWWTAAHSKLFNSANPWPPIQFLSPCPCPGRVSILTSPMDKPVKWGNKPLPLQTLFDNCVYHRKRM